MKKVLFHTLGCKVNQYDSEAMLECLRKDGYTPAREGEAADLVIVNTCTVTAEADRKSRQLLRQAIQAHPGATVVAAGCYAQRDPEKLLAIQGVDLVIGNQERGRIPELVRQAEEARKPIDHVFSLKGTDFEPLVLSESGPHTRANIKIQEGCNRFCTYCIIPYTRGPIRSRPLEDTVTEVARLAAKGVREFVLTGIHIASYGLEREGMPGLIDLLEAMDRVPGVERLRLGSVEPSLLTEDFCARAAALEHLCHHFHISLQSGCDATLKRMNRRYTAEAFAAYAACARRWMPDAGLTTDVIVGFPGETEADFEVSRAFVEEIGFSRIHVFPFSPREGTPAARMEGQVEKGEKHRRAQSMIETGNRLLQRANAAALGRTDTVLLEEPENGRMAGYTGNYTRVLVEGEPLPAGTLIKVKLERAEGENVLGRPVD